MEYNLVSADSHMDMSWLPGDLFEKNGPSHLKGCYAQGCRY